MKKTYLCKVFKILPVSSLVQGLDHLGRHYRQVVLICIFYMYFAGEHGGPDDWFLQDQAWLQTNPGLPIC